MKIGEKFLITTDNWFFAPDGEQYRSVFGTVHAVVDSSQALGVRTNAKSTNWYVLIGDTLVAGCQIHYAVRSERFNPAPSELVEIDHEGVRHVSANAVCRIYDADASGLVAGVNYTSIQTGSTKHG